MKQAMFGYVNSLKSIPEPTSTKQ